MSEPDHDPLDARIAGAVATPAGFETRRLQAAVIDAVLEREPVPTRVGRYVVLEAAGSGAMGDVYRAYDPKLQREVALKLLRLRHDEREDRARARLLREAQAMARLSHPNVAAIHDAELEGDLLFITMEFVRGTTLHKWLAQPRPWRAVLEHFVAAGRGLAAAHDEGLLHCDFKPANVLVGDEGRVRVTDFGIARLDSSLAVFGDRERRQRRPWQGGRPKGYPAVRRAPSNAARGDGGGVIGRGKPPSSSLEAGDASPDPTAGAAAREPDGGTGALFGTPMYMAPEQHEGARLTAASDQYAFCVALWEALAGAPPFAGALAVLAERKREGPPPWPSTVAVPRAVTAAIVRGLAPRPEDRWPSMNALVDRLQSALGRSRSWRLAGVSGVALLAAVAAVSLSRRDEPCTGAAAAMGAAWSPDRKAAVETAIDATRVAYADAVRTRVVTALDVWAGAWLEMHTESCLATTVRGEQTGAVMDLRMACLHRARLALDATTRLLADVDRAAVERADRMVESLPALERCADVVALQAAIPPPQAADAHAVDEVRAQLAEARAQREAGRYEAAAEALQGADTAASAIDYGPLRSELEHERGLVADARGEPEAGQPAHDAALRSALQWGQTDVAFEAAVELVGSAAEQDRVESGDAYASVAWGLLERQPRPRVAEARLRHSVSLLRESQGRYTEQQGELEAALALREEALGAEHPAVAATLISLGLCAYNQSRFDDAVTRIREGVELRTAALGAEHPEVGRGLLSLATALHGQQRFDEAEATSRKALRIAEQSLGPTHPNVADARNNIAMALTSRGRHAEAEAELRRVLEIREALGEPQRYEIARLRTNLGNACIGQGRNAEAEEEFRAALEIGEALYGEKHPLVAMTRDSLAEAIRRQGGRNAEAETQWRQAIEIGAEVMDPHHVALARTRSRYAKMLFEEGRIEESVEQYRRSVESFERTLGEHHPETSIPRWFYAKTLRAHGRADDALVQLQKLWEATQHEGYTDAERAEAAFTLAQLQWDLHRDRDEARALAERARDLNAAAGPEHAQARADVEAWLARR
jgi:serine/threonine protein kinase/tetratricopeptide (TPR) repeat protein